MIIIYQKEELNENLGNCGTCNIVNKASVILEIDEEQQLSFSWVEDEKVTNEFDFETGRMWV